MNGIKATKVTYPSYKLVGLNLKPPAYSEEEDLARHCCLDRPRSKSPERGCCDHGGDGGFRDDGGCSDHGDDGGGGYHIPLPLHSNGAPLGQGKALGLQDALNVLGHLEKHHQASEVSYQPFPHPHHGKSPPA